MADHATILISHELWVNWQKLKSNYFDLFKNIFISFEPQPIESLQNIGGDDWVAIIPGLSRMDVILTSHIV